MMPGLLYHFSMMPLDSIACWATWKLFLTLRLYLRLQASVLDVIKPSWEYGYAYTAKILEAKKQLNGLRVRKTDKIDAESWLNLSLCTIVNQPVRKSLSTPWFKPCSIKIDEDLDRLQRQIYTRSYKSHFLSWKIYYPPCWSNMELSDGFFRAKFVLSLSK